MDRKRFAKKSLLLALIVLFVAVVTAMAAYYFLQPQNSPSELLRVIRIGSRVVSPIPAAPPLPPQQTGVSSGQPIENELPAAAASQTPSSAEPPPAPIKDRLAASCGDGICDPDESCAACGDCACRPGEFCDAANLCSPAELCGDGTCTQNESPATCCTDCGCGSGKICYSEENKCIAVAGVSNSTLNKTIAAAIANSTAGYTGISVQDEVVGGKAVKIVFLYCPTTNETVCRDVLVVDGNGTVVSYFTAK